MSDNTLVLIFIPHLTPNLKSRASIKAFQANTHLLVLYRTTAISIVRLWLLQKRFKASLEDGFEYGILSNMCAVVEANVAVICTNLPTLGYKAFSDWVKEHGYGSVSGENRRRYTIWFSPHPGCAEENRELDDVAEHHRRYRERTIDV